MTIGKWSQEELWKRIEENTKHVLQLENNFDDYIGKRMKNRNETPEQARAFLKFSQAVDAEVIGRCHALLGHGKEAMEQFRDSAEKRFESMSLTYFHDTEGLCMLWTAVLSHDSELTQKAASQMMSKGVVNKLRSDLIKKKCELYANLILNRRLAREHLAEMEENEEKQCKRISGVPSGAIKSCRGIVEGNKDTLMVGLSAMLPFTRRFYGQMKGAVPVAMEEAMIMLLAGKAGICIGPEDFPKHKEMLPMCLF